MSSYVLRNYLLGVSELFQDLGGNLDDLIKETGVSRDLFNASLVPLPYATGALILEIAAKQLSRPDFALMLADKRLSMGYSSELLSYSRTAKDIEEVILGFIAQLRTRTIGIHYALVKDQNTAWFSRATEPQSNTRFIQGTLTLFATFYGMLRDISAKNWKATLISFTFKNPGNAKELKQYFNCPIQFDADIDAMYFQERLLALPISTRDDNLHEILSEYLTNKHLEDDSDFKKYVISLIQQNLAAGRADIEALASHLPYKIRTIQKKLQQAGTSYMELLNETRFEIAENLLKNSNNSLTNITHMLCFKDLSSFSKAFKHQYEISPREWRKRNSYPDQKG